MVLPSSDDDGAGAGFGASRLHGAPGMGAALADGPAGVAPANGSAGFANGEI